MRRIDAIGVAIGFFAFGGIAYLVFRFLGLNLENAGRWSQVVLFLGLLGWLATYAFRAVTHNMTYDQQVEEYKTAVLKKRLAEMSPAELEQLEAEVAQEKSQQNN